MRRMKREYRFKPKLIDLRKKRPTGLRNFKIRVKFKRKHSENLKWHLTGIQLAFKISLIASSEHVATTAGLEIELPMFELPDEVD